MTSDHSELNDGEDPTQPSSTDGGYTSAATDSDVDPQADDRDTRDDGIGDDAHTQDTSSRRRASPGEQQPESWRGKRWFLLHFALAGLGLAEPVLALLGDAPELFIAHRASRSDIFAIGAMWSIIPPLISSLTVAIVDRLRARRLGDVLHLVALTGYSVLASAALLGRIESSGRTLDLIGIAALTVILVGLSTRSGPGREVLRFMAVIPFAVFASFAAFSDAGRLAFGSIEPAPVAGIDRPVPIVMLVLDEFPVGGLLTPQGVINSDLFPNFARLADGSDFHRNALSNSIATTDSLPLILSGQIQDPDAPTAQAVPNNLFTLLDGSYSMVAVEAISSLCPEGVCEDPVAAGVSSRRSFVAMMLDSSVVWGHAVAPEVIQERLPNIGGAWAGFVEFTDAAVNPGPTAHGEVDSSPAGQVPSPGERLGWSDQMVRWINSLDSSRRADLWFGHFIAPHIPFRAMPSGQHYVSPEPGAYDVDGVDVQTWSSVSQAGRMSHQRHLFQLGFLDLQLGLFLDRLESTGLWDSALVIVTADHGASFEADTLRRWPQEENLSELYRVPLFVHRPGQDVGSVRDEPAFSVDILATIADQIGADMSGWELDGVSLLGDVPADRPHQHVHWCCLDEPADSRIEALFSVLDEQTQRLGAVETWSDVAMAGPLADLGGRSVDDLTVDPSAGFRFVVSNQAAFDDVDPASGMIPAVAWGELEFDGDLAERLVEAGVAQDQAGELLLTIDREVVGSGYFERSRGDRYRFRGLASHTAFSDGAHEVGLVIPLDLEGSTFVVGGQGGVEEVALTAADGTVLDVAARRDQRLALSRSERVEGGWEIAGTASTAPPAVPADEVLVFWGEQLIGRGEPQAKGLELPLSGREARQDGQFELLVSVDEVPPVGERISVVARFGAEGRQLDVSITE